MDAKKLSKIRELTETAINEEWSFQTFKERFESLPESVNFEAEYAFSIDLMLKKMKGGNAMCFGKEPKVPVEVAGEVSQLLIEKYGQHINNPVVLEGLLLAMQMVGGPKKAAQVVSYCAFKLV